MSRRILLFVPIALAACGQDYDLAAPINVDPAAVTECPFTEIPGTKFKRYDCNPVFTGSDEEWIRGGGVGSVGFHAEQVLGHPFYQMWYSTGFVDGNYGVGYAISADGVNWDPHPANPVYTNPGGNRWNRDSMGAVTVVWDGDANQYVLAYQGINYDTNGNGLGMITSPDGICWTEAKDGEPFVELSEPLNGIRYCWPLALNWESGVGFQGYINGGEGAAAQECAVYGYGGPDLQTITASPEVILPAGPGWDLMGVASAAVVKFDETYYMFYVGFRDWQPTADQDFIMPLDTQLGMATSADGIHWDKAPENPIADIALTQDPSVVGTVAAQVVGRRIHLWIDDHYDEVGASAVGYFLYEPDGPTF
jgi:hypothetical protein